MTDNNNLTLLKAKAPVRRFCALILAAAAVFSAVTACSKNGGENADSSEPVTTEPSMYVVTAKPDEGEGLTNNNSEVKDAASLNKTFQTTPPADAEPVGNDPAGLEASPRPDITLTMHIENRKILVGGSCGDEAVIFIRGGLKDMTYTTRDNCFMGTADLPAEGTVNLVVTQQLPGMAESDPITLTTQARNDVKLQKIKGNYHEIIGNNYRSYVVDEVDDFTGRNLYNDKQKETIKTRIAQNVDYLKSVNPNAEIIYLLVPTEMHVYPEFVPEEYVQYTGENRTAQFAQAARDGGAVVIDLYDAFCSLRDNGRYNLFHNTDTHWTYFGAYIGLSELCKHISEAWPDCVPRPEEDYGFYNKLADCGDLGEHLMIDNSLLKDYSTFWEPKFDIVANPDIFKGNRTELYHDNTTREQTIRNNREGLELPKVMIIRDSFGTPAFGIFSDAFSETYWRAMWDYEFPKNQISSLKPDYIVYMVAERNIKSIVR